MEDSPTKSPLVLRMQKAKEEQALREKEKLDAMKSSHGIGGPSRGAKANVYLKATKTAISQGRAIEAREARMDEARDIATGIATTRRSSHGTGGAAFDSPETHEKRRSLHRRVSIGSTSSTPGSTPGTPFLVAEDTGVSTHTHADADFGFAASDEMAMEEEGGIGDSDNGDHRRGVGEEQEQEGQQQEQQQKQGIGQVMETFAAADLNVCGADLDSKECEREKDKEEEDKEEEEKEEMGVERDA